MPIKAHDGRHYLSSIAMSMDVATMEKLMEVRTQYQEIIMYGQSGHFRNVIHESKVPKEKLRDI